MDAGLEMRTRWRDLQEIAGLLEWFNEEAERALWQLCGNYVKSASVPSVIATLFV